MDGLKITLEQSGDALIQECLYNGWSSVLCFCPDGTIPIAYVNIPGAVHDSQIADYENIYDKLETVYYGMAGNVPLTQLLVTLTENF